MSTGENLGFALICLVLGLAARDAGAERPVKSDPASVFHEFLEAENRGDSPAALSLVTDDVTITGLGSCSKTACAGKDAVRKEIDRAESVHTEHGRLKVRNVSRDAARGRLEHKNDASRAAGIDRFMVLVMVKLRDGKIASITRKLDASDPQTQTFVKWQQAHTSN